MRKILITGSDSYIGTSLEKYLCQWPDKYQIDTADLKKDNWVEINFEIYDVILHVAGIVHKKETRNNIRLYYKVNCDLTIEVADKARKEGVSQFIFVSSMSVYGIDTGIITPDTEAAPRSHYGKSKWKAEIALNSMADKTFSVTIVRLPMVYGKNCKGNFQLLLNLIKKCPVFPVVKNQRSMISINNLCSFLRLVIDHGYSGLFCPQNRDYVNTTQMARHISKTINSPVCFSRLAGIAVKCILPFYGKARKAFGTLIYQDCEQFGFCYCKENLEESISCIAENETGVAQVQSVSTQQIQKKMLEILVYFQKFCDENNLPFVLAGGSCLGAIRHKGFIPWDDDVDVLMLREDYERLWKLWRRKADLERYSCIRSNKYVNIHHTAIEIKDNHTTFINRHSIESDINHGIMIDVIPLDGVPASRWKRICQMVDAMAYCCFNFQRLPNHKGKVTYWLTKFALKMVSSRELRYRLWKGAEKRLSKYGTANAEYVSSFGEGMAIMCQRFPVSWFKNRVYMDFEGYKMPVPKDYDQYLKISYGNYMELPPQSERIARHDAVFIDLEHSYTRYKGVYYCVKK